jgi:hypothetical protein
MAADNQRKKVGGRKGRDLSAFTLVDWVAAEGFCSCCRAPLAIRQHRIRPLQMLSKKLLITQKDRCCSGFEVCPESATIFRPTTEAHRYIVRGCEYGLDVIAFVGESQHHRHMSLKEIHGELQQKGVSISERHVANLFRLYLAIVSARNLDSDAVRKRLEAQGRLILSVDAVRFDEVSPPLYVVRELLSGEIIAGERVATADTGSLCVLLEKVKLLGVPVAGFVSDKEHAQVAAIHKVFPGVHHQFCQAHFLGHLVKPMESELAALAKGVEKVAKEAKDLKKRLVKMKDPTNSEERKIVDKLCEAVRVVSKTRGDKILDPPALKRFNKLTNIEGLTVKALTALTGKTEKGVDIKQVEQPTVKPIEGSIAKTAAPKGALLQRLQTIFAILLSYKELARRLTRQVEIVRAIARILGLAVSGKEVEAQLQVYLETLVHNPESGRGAPMGRFQCTVKEITKRFWSGLFACYDVDGLPRTNNDLESFFRVIKAHDRRARGNKSNAGGLLESIGPILAQLWPTLQARPDLQSLFHELTTEELQKARQHIEDLSEPARDRRSFVRDYEGHLQDLIAELDQLVAGS